MTNRMRRGCFFAISPCEGGAAAGFYAQIAVIRRSERIEPIPSLPFEYSLGAESFGSLNI
jgi:hypothetical protein